MLVNEHPVDRVHRALDLLRSELPEENAAGAKELAAWLDAPVHGDRLRELLYDGAQNAPAAQRLDTPTSPWRTTRSPRGLLRAVRVVGGHVLTIRESGAQRDWFYPVIDGHHPSARGAPWAYPSLGQAMAAAEAVTAMADMAAADILAHEKRGRLTPAPVERDLAYILADPMETDR
jgi:hypothetical protein